MSMLSSLFDLFKGSLQILSQTWNFVAITTTLYLLFNSISFLLYISSSYPYLTDFILKIISLISTHPPDYTKLLVGIRYDTGVILGLQAAYALVYLFIALLAVTPIIFISSSYYNGNDLSVKQLVLKISKLWARPLVTSFYVVLLALGYSSLFFVPFLVPSLVLFDYHTLLITILVFIVVVYFVFYLYLYVVWGLAMVVSVVEYSYGLEALGKARELVKGKQLQGFLLNLFFSLVSMIVYMIGYKLSLVMPIVGGLVELVLISILNVFQTMAYTVFYFQCKQQRKRSGSLEYSPIPSAPLRNEDLA